MLSSRSRDLFVKSFNLHVSQRLIFSVACTRLYNPLCPSVGRSVDRSVGGLVGRSVTLYFFFNDFISLTSLLLPKWSGPAPAHRHATSVAVYPALFH